jgi:broad specificity phosphatase PhoE
MILLRHGQSAFNAAFTATRRDPGIPDPGLTEQGRAQAESAAAALIREEVSHIVASPYTRALQTAAPLARRLGLPVLINPVVRERYAFSCDVGSTRTALAHAWPDLDFAHLDEVWWPAALEPHSGGEPLGVHPEPDRSEPGQRRVAALRPDRGGGTGSRRRPVTIGRRT